MAKSFEMIKEQILQQIAEGRWQYGERLNSMRDMCAELGTSLMTLDRALRDLVGDGVLLRHPNKGFYLADNPEQLNGTIMLVIHHLNPATSFPSFASGVEQAARSRNYHVNIFCMLDQIDLCMEAAKRAVCLKAKGVIYAPASGGDKFAANAAALNLLHGNNIPVVLAGHCDLAGFEDFPRVSSNHESGARKMAEHLIRLGYRRIGIIGKGPTSDHARIEKSFCETFAEHGISMPDRNIHFVIDDKFIPAAVRQIMHGKETPEAIFAIGDDFAADAISVLREMNLSIPEDIAVTGFGDFPVCRFLSIPLTTVKIRHEEEGVLAAGLLLNIIEGHCDGSRQIEVPCDLIVRQSCGTGYMPTPRKNPARREKALNLM